MLDNLINKQYTSSIVQSANQVFLKEKVVVLKKIIDDKKLSKFRKTILKLTKEKEYHPLKFKWTNIKNQQLTKLINETQIKLLSEFISSNKLKDVEIKIMESSDFSLLHDDLKPLNGPIAIIDLSEKWDNKWGGFIGIEQEPFELEPNSLTIINAKNRRWFIKKINHHAGKHKKILLILK